MSRTNVRRAATNGSVMHLGSTGASRGQSLVIAIVVMFILLFIGGIFVGLVARNLINTSRSRDTVSAAQFAQAGIRLADHNLQYSPEGADWRPAPTPVINVNDPDRRWLESGYTRVDLGKGRALIRVSMQPDPRNPLGKYLRIDAVGRVGFLDPNDPTTFLNTPAPRLRREYVAYKAIGITDYLRYVTNITNETKAEAAIGVPPIGVPLYMQIGGLPIRTKVPVTLASYQTPGGPMRVNCGLRLLDNLTMVVDSRNNEAVLVSGKITVDDGTDPLTRPKFKNAADAGAPLLGYDVVDSSDPAYSTFAGLLRDDGSNPDATGFARSISRQDPPNIGAVDQATQVARYLALTRDSGLWFTRPDTSSFNTGRYALGAGLYIDNFGSVERQSEAVSGGQSMRSVWLKPGSTSDWSGPFYIPPGVFVEFGYPVVQDRDAAGDLIPGQYVRRPGVHMVRDVTESTPFRDPRGNIEGRTRDYTFLIYKPANRRPVLKLETESMRAYLRDVETMTEAEIDAALPEYNGTIYAEGNIRVRGLLPGVANIPIRRESGDGDGLTDAEIRERVNPPSVSLVSGNNIYIEGSLLRENQEAMIGLLATNFVTVNTTMFMSPNKGMSYQPSNQDERAPYHTQIDTAEAASAPPFSLNFIFGDDPQLYTDLSGNPVPLRLLMRHGVAPGNTFLNLAINEAFPPAPPDNAYYRFNSAGYPAHVYPMQNDVGTFDLFEQRAFTLYPKPGTYVFFNQPGVLNTLRPSVDTTYIEGSGAQDYLLSRAAVVPMDIRIEAMMYAQNGSFFVIPGYAINTNPADTREAAVRRAQAAGLPSGQMLRPGEPLPTVPPTPDADRFALYPFYNEPYDCRITVVGAIAENRTASIADQAAWMQLWGYVPETMGSTGASPNAPTAIRIPKEHVWVGEVGSTTTDLRTDPEKNFYSPGNGITRGLRILYDPALSAPYPGHDPTVGSLVIAPGNWSHVVNGAFRQDDYGRTLPALPRLPVCPGFVFQGEVR